MARPERRDVDYFPFIVKDGKTLFILEGKYQCKGTGFFTNVMRVLSRTPDHHVCIKDEADRLYFFTQCKCDEESGMDMIELMVKTGKLDKELWTSNSVIASQDFLTHVADAYRLRSNEIISIDQIKLKYGVINNINEVSNVGNEVNNVNKPQSKAKQSKAKYTKAKGGVSPAEKDLALSPTGDAQKTAKDEEPFVVPCKEDIEAMSEPEVKKSIWELRIEISKDLMKPADLSRFDAYAQGKNRKAVLHTLAQCYRQRPRNPGGFCRSVLDIEEGNFNATDYQAEHAQAGPSREEAKEMLGKIMPAVKRMP